MMLSKMLLLSPAAGEVAAIACVSAAKSRREKAESRPNDDVPKVMVTGRDAHTGRAKTCFRWVSFTRLFFCCGVGAKFQVVYQSLFCYGKERSISFVFP